MTRMTARRQVSTTLRGFVLFLCAAIFAWGLHGKLTLYKAPTSARKVSTVKLMRDDEVVKKFFVFQLSHSNSDVQLADQAPIRSFPPRFRAHRISLPDKQVLRAIPFYPHALLFRPPPSIV
jgi:hypothetical protein